MLDSQKVTYLVPFLCIDTRTKRVARYVGKSCTDAAVISSLSDNSRQVLELFRVSPFSFKKPTTPEAA